MCYITGYYNMDRIWIKGKTGSKVTGRIKHKVYLGWVEQVQQSGCIIISKCVKNSSKST